MKSCFEKKDLYIGIDVHSHRDGYAKSTLGSNCKNIWPRIENVVKETPLSGLMRLKSEIVNNSVIKI